MQITLMEACPACKADGKEVMLAQELGQDEVFCPRKHKFATFEAVQKFKPVPRLKIEPKVPKAAPAATPNVEEVPAAPAPAFAMPPADFEDLGTSAPVQEFVEGPGIPEEIPEIVNATQDVVEEVTAAVVRDPQKAEIVENSARIVDGGRMELRIHIPDQYVEAVKSIAFDQGKTVEQFMDEQIAYAFESRWII